MVSEVYSVWDSGVSGYLLACFVRGGHLARPYVKCAYCLMPAWVAVYNCGGSDAGWSHLAFGGDDSFWWRCRYGPDDAEGI